MKKLVLFLAVISLSGCAAKSIPSSLSGIGVTYYQANEVVVALDAVMSSAIALNTLQICDPTCHPVLSEQNTRVVVQAIRSADLTLKQIPGGWQLISTTALDQVSLYLDSNGREKILPYIIAAKSIIAALGVK